MMGGREGAGVEGGGSVDAREEQRRKGAKET